MSFVDGVKMRDGNRCKEDEWENTEDQILILGVVFPHSSFLDRQGQMAYCESCFIIDIP